MYRDLLSSNDKALQQQQGGDQKNKRPESQNIYITNFGGGEDEGKPTEVKFKGKLSIGIDELSNTLVVSTEGENLMTNVERLIESLDNAARPSLSTVRVLQTRGSMDSKDVRKALARALIDQQLQKQQQQRQGQQQPGQNPAATAAAPAATSGRERRNRRAVALLQCAASVSARSSLSPPRSRLRLVLRCPRGSAANSFRPSFGEVLRSPALACGELAELSQADPATPVRYLTTLFRLVGSLSGALWLTFSRPPRPRHPKPVPARQDPPR